MAVKEKQDMCVDIQNVARKSKTTERQEKLEEKAVWNHESFQGNLYYVRQNELSTLLLIVSAIHVFIQQTFSGNPLNARHCATESGSVRQISSRTSPATAPGVPATEVFL